jgi:hypothetical protein
VVEVERLRVAAADDADAQAPALDGLTLVGRGRRAGRRTVRVVRPAARRERAPEREAQAAHRCALQHAATRHALAAERPTSP